jgi:hypothetical protein
MKLLDQEQLIYEYNNSLKLRVNNLTQIWLKNKIFLIHIVKITLVKG